MYICTNNPNHKYSTTTSDGFCPVSECHGIGYLVDENLMAGVTQIDLTQKNIPTPILPHPPTHPATSSKTSTIAPLAIGASGIFFILLFGFLIFGAIVVSAINTQNTHATQTTVAQNRESTIVAQNRTATAIAQNRTATAIYNRNVQSTKTAIAQSKTAAAQSALFYSEDFNYASEWEWGDGTEVEYLVENGKLKGEVFGQIVAWTFAGKSFSDIKIEVDVNKISGSDLNEFGIICNATDNRHFYAFVIGSDQTYQIWRQDGDDSTQLVEWASSLDINDGTKHNTVTVICNGGSLTLLVNGNELTTVYDTTYTEGDVGVIVGQFEENSTVSVYFDNFNVSNP